MSKKVHFIAIGGAVMHNLALELKRKGFEVSGSDDEIYEPAKGRLESAGLLPKSIGWNPDNINSDIDEVVLGMHAKADNPELLKAKELGLKIYSFPAYIFEQSLNKQRIVIAGSHGKTTITSIILHVLNYNKKKFDYLVGAQIDGFDLMVKLSDAPIIIIEGDEYLSSALERFPKFLHYKPHIALISGIAWDHFNVFPEFSQYKKAFEDLIKEVPKAGSLVFDTTDNTLKEICEDTAEDVTVNPYKAHPYEIKDGNTFLIHNNTKVPIQLFGEHNMKNLMGAKHILTKLAITDEQFYEAIQHFSGAAKRLQKLGENEQTLILKDFAHSPSKVLATTKATKELYPKRKLIACYELHTYSSLNKEFLPHYKDALSAADQSVAFYSPKTLEIKGLPAVNPEDIKKAFNHKDLIVFTERTELEEYLMKQNWYQSNLLLMSSGTFGQTDTQELANKVLALETTKPEKKGIRSFFTKK